MLSDKINRCNSKGIQDGPWKFDGYNEIYHFNNGNKIGYWVYYHKNMITHKIYHIL